MSAEQAVFRYQHKIMCMERAIERCDYHAANIFCAQAAYYRRLITGEALTTENRNGVNTSPCKS
jgi:hypothetical protein